MAMLRAMDSAVAGLRAHQSKLDVIGHNIANVNTYGYKSQNYSFQEAMYQTSTASTAGGTSSGGVNAAQYGYGSLTGSISMDMTASTPTYVAGFNATISGQGFFVTCASNGHTDVTSVNMKRYGDLEYTRVGQFSIDSNGYVVDSSGNFVYGYNSAADGTVNPTGPAGPLRVPGSTGTGAGAKVPLLTSVKLNDVGLITGVDTSGKVVTIGQLAIATFQNPEGLTKTGGYYYQTITGDNTGTPSLSEPGGNKGSTPTLMAGYLEASNVDLAKEFSEMITAQRGFQANTKMITVSDEILNELVNMKR